MTTATLLTPPGTGAIATIELRGPEAVRIAEELFSQAIPPLGQFRFGRLLGDDVVLTAVDEAVIEIHCHGGRAIVELMLREIALRGAVISTHEDEWSMLQQAPTLRTANILLDQLSGAFTATVENLDRLAALAPLARHLTQPWKVAIAGAPNAGKSSLINALAGYERAIVSPVAGTTRDAVSTVVAFDGWPVELTDTAGLRDSRDPLEAAGIARARTVLAAADVIVWVFDATAPVEPAGFVPHLVVSNKCDLAEAFPDTLAVSAKTGQGLAALIGAIVRLLVREPPMPGEAVPYTPALATAVLEARARVATGQLDAARECLATATGAAE